MKQTVSSKLHTLKIVTFLCYLKASKQGKTQWGKTLTMRQFIPWASMTKAYEWAGEVKWVTSSSKLARGRSMPMSPMSLLSSVRTTFVSDTTVSAQMWEEQRQIFIFNTYRSIILITATSTLRIICLQSKAVEKQEYQRKQIIKCESSGCSTGWVL